MGDVQPKSFLLLTIVAISDILIILIHDNDQHCIVFWKGKAMGIRNPLWKNVYSSCIHKAKSATWYFGVLSQSAWDVQGRVTRHKYRLASIAYPNLA